jgi:hypothetical protein
MLSDTIDVMARGITEIPPNWLRSTALQNQLYFAWAMTYLSVCKQLLLSFLGIACIN